MHRRFSPFMSVISALGQLFSGRELDEQIAIAGRDPAFRDRNRKPYRGYQKPGKYKPHQGKREMARRRRLANP